MNFAVLALSWWLAVGVLPEGGVASYNPPTLVSLSGSYFSELGAEGAWGPFFVGGKMRAAMWHDNTSGNFWPNQLESEAHGGLRWGPVELGISYDCAHPVTPYLPMWFGSQAQFTESSNTTIYLRIDGHQDVNLTK